MTSRADVGAAAGQRGSPRGRPGRTRRAALRLAPAVVSGAGMGWLAAGCGANTSTAPQLDPMKQVDLRLAVRSGQVDTKLWQDLAADFNGRFPKIKVTAEEYAPAEFTSKILTLSAGDAQPDVMQFSDEPFFEFAHKGLFLDVDPFVERDRRSLKTEDFFPGVLDFWRWDAGAKVPGRGKLYGLPRAAGTELLVYNRRVFQESNVPEPPADGNWTWNDFLERSRRLVRRQGDEATRAAMPLPAFRASIAWLAGWGAPLLADTTKRVSTTNNPGSLDVFRTIADYRLNNRIVPLAAEARGSTFRGNVYDLLAKGTYAMILNIGYLYNFREAFKDDPANWEVAPMPRGPKGNAVRGAWSPFAVGGQTRQQAAAWEFMKYATGPDGQTTLMQLGYLFSVRRSIAEKVFVDPKSPQHEERWLEATRNQHFEPLCEVYPKIQQVHNFYWSQVTDEGVRRPVNEALRLIDETVNKIFQGGDLPADWEGLPKS